MVILGLILVLIALALGAALLLGTSTPDLSGQDVDIKLFDAVTINLNPLTLVIAGMVTMLVLWLGLVLIKWALTRKAKQRRLRKEQAAVARERQAEQEAAHRDEVAQRDLEDQRTQRVDTGAGGATRPIRHDGVDDGATRPIRHDGVDDGATRPIRREGDPRL